MPAIPARIRRDHAGMTKAENRAAAKVYQEEKLRKWRKRPTPQPLRPELEQITARRKYLLFDIKLGVSADSLIEAKDGYVEKLTGARRVLHAQHPSMEDLVTQVLL